MIEKKCVWIEIICGKSYKQAFILAYDFHMKQISVQ
jgi:hypothetical protein